ncbi:hypothetical protein B5181_14750 [Streptomyces sp. 4F]|nr:hypothetical protein B5181_14750 [Streptomyces sp. 4F]
MQAGFVGFERLDCRPQGGDFVAQRLQFCDLLLKSRSLGFRHSPLTFRHLQLVGKSADLGKQLLAAAAVAFRFRFLVQKLQRADGHANCMLAASVAAGFSVQVFNDAQAWHGLSAQIPGQRALAAVDAAGGFCLG